MTNNYESIIFKRGYVISDSKIQKPRSNWSYIFISNYHIYYDPNNEIHFHEENGKWIFILGLTIDILLNTIDKSITCKYLLDKLNESEEEFFNYIDDLSGRYFILFFDGSKTRILSDASGMRTIIYNKKPLIIALHPKLVETYSNAGPDQEILKQWEKNYGGYRIPGHFTIYNEVKFLTPNTLLELETMKVKRFYPRGPLQVKSVEKVSEEISQLVKVQLDLVAQKYPKLLFSLTAGIDSRTTLALSKKILKNIQFFTYYKQSKNIDKIPKSLEIDREVVIQIVENLNLKHTFIPLNIDDSDSEYKNFMNAMKNNTFSHHSYRLAKFYYDQLPNDALHIRSNILEIGRYFYRGKYKLPENVSMSGLAHCYSPKAANDIEIQNLFEQYYNEVEMDKIFNYDPYDILYWEYRMGTWHALLLLESDVAHETFIPFNTRNILNLMLSVPEKDKKNFTIFKNLITRNWSILDVWGINSLAHPINNLYDESKKYGLALNHIVYASSTLDGTDRIVNMEYRTFDKKCSFNLKDSAPKKGDYAEVAIPLKTDGSSRYHCILNIRSYYENLKNVGRLKYQVLLNDVPLLEEDISQWKETNQVNIHFKSLTTAEILKIRVIAIKNCEDWNWGKASTIIIENVALRKSELDYNMVEATSPHSKVLENQYNDTSNNINTNYGTNIFNSMVIAVKKIFIK